MNTTLLDKDVKRYVDAVASALADLPDATRAEILEDLAAHLAEFDLDHGNLETQLGDPAAYAEELRASAGFAPLAPLPPGTSPGPQLAAQARRLIDKVRTHRWWTETRAFLPLLEPAWWVMRAWLVVVVIAGATPSDIPVPAPGGNVLLGLGMVALAIRASVRIGRLNSKPRHLYANRAANLLGIIMLLAFFGGVRDQPNGIGNNIFADVQRQTVPVMVFDMTGQRALGTPVPVTVDGYGYMIGGAQTVMLDGLPTTVGPCPNRPTYAACLLQEPITLASTTTIPSAALTTVVPIAPPVTTATVPQSTTTAVPVAPSTSGG